MLLQRAGKLQSEFYKIRAENLTDGLPMVKLEIVYIYANY